MVLEPIERGAPQETDKNPAAEAPSPDAAEAALDISDHQSKKIPSKTWRECLKKVWEVDPLACPRCGGEMKLVSFIDQPPVIRHILEHLGLWRERLPKGLPPPEETIPDAVVPEEFDDGWGRYEEPSLALH